MRLILVDGPHDGIDLDGISIYPGDSLVITSYPKTAYFPMSPYPQHDSDGRLKMTTGKVEEVTSEDHHHVLGTGPSALAPRPSGRDDDLRREEENV